MAGTFVVNGSNTTVSFAYTATTTKVQAIVLAAARHFYDVEALGPNPPSIPFGSLTNQQKLDYIDLFVKRLINEAAREQKMAEAIAAAAADADQNLSV